MGDVLPFVRPSAGPPVTGWGECEYPTYSAELFDSLTEEQVADVIERGQRNYDRMTQQLYEMSARMLVEYDPFWRKRGQ